MTNTYKLALIGYPLGHSFSPILYEAAFKSLGLYGSYEILPTQSEDLITRIKFLRKNKYYGFNVTIPHKVPTTLFLNQYDEYVNLTGAVNTVKVEEDQTLSGYNTDVWGFCEAIPKDIDLKGKKAAVLGTGGAARAICAGLYTKGVAKIDFYTRNVINSSEAISVLRERFKTIEIQALQTSLIKDLSDVDILVNTTPLGMKSFNENACPLTEENIQSLPTNAVVYDIVYNPLRTVLIERAIKYNKRFIQGLDMLIWQAVRAIEIWCNLKPDFNVLKVAALERFLLEANSRI